MTLRIARILPRSVSLSRWPVLCTVLFLARFADADTSAPAPALPEIPGRVFTIDGQKIGAGEAADAAPAIQQAIDAAAAAGGGVVELPPGETLSGPLRFASNINLRIPAGSTLKMLPMDRYPGRTTDPKALITGKDLHDVAITGAGTIDGQGAPWWPFAKTQKDYRRPRMIVFGGCDRILIEQVRLQNSPMFHIAISGGSSNVTVRGVTVRAPASTDPVNPSHNTDACDVSAKHVRVEDCDVSVGDDNFTCGGGTSDVLIRHCTYGYGHGVSIGSPTSGGVADLTVEDCTFTNTECGIRIKSDRDRGGLLQHLTYRNLRMTNVGMPILVYASYNAVDKEYRDLTNLTPEIAATYPAKPVTPKTPVYRDITFSDITASVSPGHRAGLIFGLPEAPVDGLLMRNVDITADKPFGIFHATDVKIENCRIVTPEGENKFSRTNAQVTITN